VRKSSNLSLFGYSLNKIKVQAEGGSYQDGELFIDPEVYDTQDKNVELSIRLREKRGRHFKKVIELPFPEQVKLSLHEKETLIPGQSEWIDFELRYSDGQVFQYHRGRSRKGPDQHGIEIGSQAKLSEKYMLSLENSLEFVDAVKVLATHRRADIRDSLWIPVDYRSHRYTDFSGSDAVLDWDGEDGQDVNMYAQMRNYEGRTFLAVKLVSKEKEESYLLEEGGEGLYVDVGGGDGGRGDDGEDGDDGSNEDENHAAQPGEDGRNGEQGGDGGNGGRITIFTDAESRTLLAALVQIENDGGEGGPGGEGGDGGDGGRRANGKRLASGKDGNQGMDGSDGRDGGAPRIELLSPSQLRLEFDPLRTY